MIKDMAGVSSNGRMDENTMVLLKMVKNMEKLCILIRKESERGVYGKMENMRGGLIRMYYFNKAKA